MREKGAFMEDITIIDLFFQRDEKAISALAEKHGKLFRKLARNILQNEADAEECVNDTYLAVWNAIPPKKPQSLTAFVCGIARNIATARYHHLTAEKRNSFYDVALDELCDCIPADETADGDSGKPLTEAINSFLETLSEEENAIFVRRYYFSEPIAEIAREWSVSSHYISVKLSRIREKLRKFLEKRGIRI